ncbi:hypothetical protein [Defluviimonas salinarum]|uniref:Uncharacterized protein n=1 Tax=Defluviimonas salinarum TaxID=2992147 RepID=A0ABT3J114_9RHOB|nr:hypothetical protein [Defluviimonas salinarum]
MTRIGAIIGLGVLALGPALPASAGGKFKAPEGCEVFTTVQLRGCQVSQHYRCEKDQPGDQWAVYLDQDGPFYASRVDAETRWVESYDLTTGERDTILSEADPASFTMLLATGRDDYDFRIKSSTGEVRHYTGWDTLTGEAVTIDGVVLERTRFDLTAEAEDGTVLWHRSGQQFVHHDWRLFFADQETFEAGSGETESRTDTPVDFAFPGDKGFLATEPSYDCNMTMTEAVLPLDGEGYRQ